VTIGRKRFRWQIERHNPTLQATSRPTVLLFSMAGVSTVRIVTKKWLGLSSTVIRTESKVSETGK